MSGRAVAAGDQAAAAGVNVEMCGNGWRHGRNLAGWDRHGQDDVCMRTEEVFSRSRPRLPVTMVTDMESCQSPDEVTGAVSPATSRGRQNLYRLRQTSSSSRRPGVMSQVASGRSLNRTYCCCRGLGGFLIKSEFRRSGWLGERRDVARTQPASSPRTNPDESVAA